MGGGDGEGVCWEVNPGCFACVCGRSMVWKLHSSNCYTVSSAYNNFTVVDKDNSMSFTLMVWIKVVPLKISIFAWRLILNGISTEDNLIRWRIIAHANHNCSENCGIIEDNNHFFFQCDFYGQFGLLFMYG